MKTRRVRWISVILLLLMAILIATSGHLPTSADVSSPAEMLQRAWRNAQAAGSYRFVSDAEQTLIPRAVPEMIGQRDTTLNLALDGAVLLPDRSYTSLQVIGNGRSGSVALLRDGAQSFMLQDGQVKPVEDALSLATPSNDLLGYLSAAENVRVMAPPEGHPELTRYSFELNGERFEAYVRQQTQVALRAEPGAPEGLALQPSPSLQKMSGHGELWVAANGLPVRQVLDADMPEVNAQYGARIHMVIDLTAHGQVETLPRAVQGTDGAWYLEGGLTTNDASGLTPPAAVTALPNRAARAVTAAAAAWRARLSTLLPLRIARDSLALFILIVLVLAIGRYYRRSPRRCATILVAILIPILALSPLLQAGKVVRFQDRQAQVAAARQATTPDLLHALGLETAAPDAGSAAPARAKGDDTSDTGVPPADPLPAPAAASNLPSPARNNGIARAQGESTSGMQRCGDGEPGVDSDSDGLDDTVELCLGTSPRRADTDKDGIPDKTEIDGFDYAGKHWTSDPLNADSNSDGVVDIFEWATNLTPNGLAPAIDIDGDGIPNLWDSDDDKDDVPDAQDLSPFARSSYTTTLSLSTEGSGFSGYEYIQIQVQPEITTHLRYSTTALDWPMDQDGQVQDLDLSTDDLRLTPYLLVTTNVQPPTDLAKKYGFSSWQSDNGYVLLVPLLPVGEGGAIHAFSGKVAYGPGQTADIQWQAKMVWMAQMQVDRSQSYSYVTEARVLHQYQDSFRLTGLDVTKDQGYEAAVLGTPEDVDDLRLFRLLLGLNDVFKSNVHLEGQESGETALQEIAQRFAMGSTANITHTFGVERPKVAMSGPLQYGLMDAAIAGIGSDLVPNFLNKYGAYYGNERCADVQGHPVSCASLIIAFEQKLGAKGLSEVPQTSSGVADLAQLHFNLANIPLVTSRGVQMRMYEEGANGWQVVSAARMLELVEARYSGSYATALRDLYPGLDVGDLRFLSYAAYLWATGPSYAPVAADGQPLVPDLADETQLALNRALPPDLEGYVETAVDYFALGCGLANAVGAAQYIAWTTSDFIEMKSNWDGVGVGLFLCSVIASTAMAVISAYCDSGKDGPLCDPQVLKALNAEVGIINIIYQTQWVLDMVMKYAMGILKEVSLVAMTCQAIGTVISVSVIWAFFAMTAMTAAIDPVTWRQALAEAIVMTVWYIILFALQFVPIVGQIIAAVLALIDMILSLFTGLFGDQTWSIATALLAIFYGANVCTSLADAAFGELSTGLADPDGGMVSGNTLLLNLPGTGLIQKEDGGTDDDLRDSWVKSRLTWQWPAYDQSIMFTAQDRSQPPDCDIVDGELHCSNTATLGYALTPRINGLVSFGARIVYQYVWAETAFYGAVRYATHKEQGTLPEEADNLAPNKMYLDVLPADLDQLWNWSPPLTNPDHDGDGLTDSQEGLGLGTDPSKWDTDGDGLSDYHEWLTSAERGANPLRADTDNDGLNDGLEWRLGTRIDVADSDGDGLSDGQEVRRLQGGVMVGGWQVTVPGGPTAWLSSDPLRPDSDGDGLNDAEEKVHGLSPWAVNSPVPALSLSVAPVRGVPGGRAGAYWETGEVVTMTVTLANTASEPVNTTLTLDFPAWLHDIQGGTLQGDRTVYPGIGSGILSWSFAGADKLQVYEVVSTTITARVSATSASDEIDLSLPYGDLELRRTFNAVVDGDNPNVSVQVPANGAFLRGSTLVVGGSATDPTTWVTGAELSIVPQGNAPDFQPLTGTLSPWAYSWSLPGDGVYTLQARATDAMGHQSTSTAVNVTVDNTPPTATLSYAMDGSTVHLSGTATDNRSGVQWVQLSIDGQPWRGVTLDGSAWSYDWTVAVSAQGTHEVKLRAFDRSGNQGDTVTQEIVVDQVAPSSDVSGGADPDVPPAVKATTAFTLTGVADEGGHLPLPAIPPDLRTGMDVFADSTVWLGLSSIRENDGGVLAAWAGDLNADRMADLAVGLPGPTSAAGRVVILYGRAGGWSVPPDLEMLTASPTSFLGAAGTQLGSYVAAAGDTNADNFYDLLIGERASTRAFLIFGNPGAMGEVTLDGGHAGYRTLLQAPETITGLATAGDVNGDSYADLLIRAGGTAYLVFGRSGPWPETLDVAAKAAASWTGVTGARGVGDVNDDQLAEWVTMAPSQIKLYHWNDSSGAVETVSTVATADAAPRVVALGDVDGDDRADWLYSNGTSRTLVYGGGGTHPFSGYDGLFAAPGDVDGDGRSDILLATAAGVASLIRQQAGESPEILATVSGVGGAANAPYAAGADLNADGSAELLLIPSQAAAEARGFDAPNFGSGFVSPQALPMGASTGSASEAVEEMTALEAGALSAGPDTRYVDDDAVSNACDGHSPCYTTIQLAVNASDGGGDTIMVYPGVYAPFTVTAGITTDHLTVQGVSADAVFVDGAGADAIRIAADGVRLSNLTVRNAQSGVALLDGAGEATQSGGSETFVDHLVAHSVQYPISMSQGAALTLSDSTLVGDGTHELVYVDPGASSIHSWNNDRAVPLPVSGTMLPILISGTLVSAGNALYALQGGTNSALYQATPGSGGALGDWSSPFSLKHALPPDKGASYQGKNLLVGSNAAIWQLHSSFQGLGFGTLPNGSILAVAIAPNGDIYVGGEFTRIAGVDASHIARWDGTSWHKVGNPDDLLDNGTNGSVRALTFDDVGNLYLGGDFTQAGRLGADHLAGWNGSSWFVLGTEGTWSYDGTTLLNGVDGPVHALVYDAVGELLYIGGAFAQHKEAEDPITHGIYRSTSTNLTAWNPNGTPGGEVRSYPSTPHLDCDGAVYALTLGGSGSGRRIYLGGDFTVAGGGDWSVTAKKVAKYDPSGSFSALGTGLDRTPLDMVVDTQNHLNVATLYGVYEWDGTSWAALGGLSGTSRMQAVAMDGEGNVYAGGDSGYMFMQEGGVGAFRKLAVTNPFGSGHGGTYSYDILALTTDSTGQLYVGLREYDNGALRGALEKWTAASFYQRSVPTGSWTRLAYPPTTDLQTAPMALVADDSENFYAVWGNYQTGVLYRFDVATNTWTQKASPDPTLNLKHLVWADGKLYAAGPGAGDNWRFVRYDPVGNSWVQMADPPIASGAAAVGLSWSWDGMGNIYLLRGDGTSAFARYAIGTNTWEWLPTPSVSFTISNGPAMARVGNYLYVYATPSGATTNLFHYGRLPASELRLTVDRTAFVVPDAASSFKWTNLSAARGTAVFYTDIDPSNAWVGPASASWSPALPTGATQLTSAQAAFVAPADGLYRLGAGSTLAAGYQQYKAVAHVYPSEAACSACESGSLIWGDTAFATIREAVESGAARVLVHPGRYPQRFYLVSGVDIIGSGAESTIIEPPAGTAATLVTAEGVAGSSLSRVTLAGGASWQGFLAEGGARGLRLARNIIRDLSTGVRLRQGSEVEVVNNTIVRNGTGLVADTNNPVNVRNTIFAYNTGTGLQRSATPASLSVTYNDFWGNGTAMNLPDGSEASLFFDPRFRSPATNDLRLAASSRLIDMGAPNDPAPPGGGTRVDIGYAEYNAASFYVSPGYSETGLNDGLVWGVDAFDTIQAGLDAAADALHSLQGALPAGGYSVGVDDGTYAETVTVPSHVRLVGSGAAVTTIDAGNAGSAVTFDAVIDAGVSGMTLRNASASGAGVEIKNSASGITIARNVIVGNAAHGVSLAGRSSAALSFDTIVNNAGAGVYATGAGTWAAVRNSILDGNALGLQVASSGLIRNDYDLLHNTTNLSGVTAGEHTLTGDPAFAAASHYVPTAASPAIDAADPLAGVPPAGGVRADLGYKELIASPLNLLFGPQIESTVTGNSGVARVEVGVTLVSDATQPVTATLPSTWQTLTPAASGEPLFFWSKSLSQGTAGYYRAYSRATDVAGNREEDESDWYEGAFVIDNTAPTVAWGTPSLPGSTDAAAVLAVAQASGTVSTGTGTRNDVSQVYFNVTGPSGPATYPAEGGRAWIRLPATGSHTISAVAVDEAGNQAQTSATVAVSASSSVATVSDPRDGTAVADIAVTLHGYVRFVGSGTGLVDVSVSGGGSVEANLESPGAAFSAWSADITLPAGAGAKTVTVTPFVGGTAGAVTTLNLTLDTTAPSLSITTPAAGTAVTRTVTFAGSASDAGSGLQQVAVSLDGGFTWQQANLSGGDWSLSHEFDTLEDYVSYPARVRAIDGAGNVTVVERPVVVESVPPTGLAPVTFSQPVGQHVGIGSDLTIGWNVPVDAGGSAQVLLAVDQISTTVPSWVMADTTWTGTFLAVGDWYVHLMSQDTLGNQALYHYGPWHVRDMANPTFGARRQSIIVDGLIELERNEWLPGDLLGSSMHHLQTQQLYASWDGQAIYLGWSGAWWTLDGQMWAYLDVNSTGGSKWSVGGAQKLPFDADLAVLIDSPEEGSLYTWNSNSWVLSASPLDFGHGPSGDTEARIPYALGASQTVELVAFALPPEEPVTALAAMESGAQVAAAGDEGEPWALFPDTNPLDEPPVVPYVWTAPVTVQNMNDGQPTARTVTMQVSSPQAGGMAGCPVSTVQYDVLLQNPEANAISGLTLILTPTSGLNYDSVSGATYAPVPGAWAFNVPPIAAGAAQSVVVKAKLAADLSSLTAVTTTMLLSGGDTVLTGPPVAELSHQVDGQAPTVTLDSLPGSAIAPSSHLFTGTADDGAGSGAALVAVSTNGGGTWQPASGTQIWSALLATPASGTFTLQARAVDRCGYISTVVSHVYNVDSTNPAIAWTVPSVITSTAALLNGTAWDPQPAGALVARVDVQLDSETASWFTAVGPEAPQDGVQPWWWTWTTPQDDGVQHTLRARALDGVGKLADTGWQTTVVDVVAPQITVTAHLDNVILPDDPLAAALAAALSVGQSPDWWAGEGGVTQRIAAQVLSSTPVLTATVTDGAGVQSMRVLVYDPLGGVFTGEATLANGSWVYAPDLAGWVSGTYALRVQAVDIHGNTSTQGPYLLQLQEASITGLAAANSGPCLIGQTVIFTATVTTGSNLTYNWSFDDGGTGDGRIVTHAYAEDGTYTAIVTATNSTSTLNAQTTVTILALAVEAGPNQTAKEGATVFITATFTGGQAGVTYAGTIDWGDGTTPAAGTVDQAAFTITGSHVYADNGTYTVAVTADAGGGNTASDTLQVTVSNVAPTAALDNDGPQGEGSAVTVWFKDVLDPGSADTLTYSFDWNNDGTYEIVDRATSSAQHTWPDNGTYTVKGKIADDDGGMNEYTTAVTVNNVPPEVNAGDDATINEGGTFSSSGSFSDPGSDIWNATVDYADGSGVQLLTLTGKTFTLSHSYADNGSYLVQVCVSDDDLGSDCDTAQVTVSNVAPTAALDNDGPQGEGSAVTVWFKDVLDPGSADTLTYSFDWNNDGTYEIVDQATSSAQHTWPDNGTYTVKGKIADDDGGMNECTTAVIVNNVPPEVNAGDDATINEGGTFSSSGSFSDPGSDIWNATVDYADGSGVQPLTLTGKTFALSHSYTDNGSYAVQVCVSDDDLGSDCDTAQVTVSNVAPTAALDNDGPQAEGSAVTVWFKDVLDPGSADTLTYSFDWNNDGTYETVDQATSSAQYTWPDDGTYTVKGRIKDDDGGMSEYTTVVIVNNVPPEVNAGDDATINEGGTFSGSGSFSDPGSDIWNATVDYADGSGVQPLTLTGKTFALSHSYADSGSYSLQVCVSDDDLGSDCDTAQVSVSNAAPAVSAAPISQTVQYGDAIRPIVVTAADVATDTLSAALTWAPWGLALGPSSCSTSAGVRTCTWQVTGSPNVISGTYTVRVTVTDKDGSSGYADAAITVRRAPPALGDVNGDGLINSTDALIILAADVGFDTSRFCPMNCGDSNWDGLVNSLDALIILSYDVGLPVPFPIGQSACPWWVVQPPGCGF